MHRVTPKQIAELTHRLETLTGDRLVAVQHTTLNNWTLRRYSDSGVAHYGAYGMPEGYCQPAQFVAHLRQALWAAERMRELSALPDIQRIELAACPMVPGTEPPETP